MPSCDVISCPSPESPANGLVLYSDHNYGATAEYGCSDGYRLSGLALRTCQSDGSWSGSIPACNVVNCSLPVAPDSGSAEFHCRHYGCHLLFDCSEGYKLRGVGSHLCGRDGRWSEAPPICQPIICEPTPVYIDHGLINFTTTSFMSAATVMCDEGYESDVTTLTCQQDGGWACGDDSQCRGLDCAPVVCPAVAPSENVTLVVPQIPTFGSQLTAECQYGFKLVGDRVRECLANSTWSGTQAYCHLITCPAITPGEHTTHTLTDDSRGVGTTAKFSCDSGYKLEGEKAITCKESSEWSSTVPTCEPIVCGEPPTLLNGLTKYQELSHGSNASYICNRGWVTWTAMFNCVALAKLICTRRYELKGSQVRRCLGSGTWSGFTPKCSIINCSPPSSIVHARAHYENLSFGSQLIFSCSNG